MADPFSDGAVLVDVALGASFTICIGASIDRVCQYVVNRYVGGGYPENLSVVSEVRMPRPARIGFSNVSKYVGLTAFT